MAQRAGARPERSIGVSGTRKQRRKRTGLPAKNAGRTNRERPATTNTETDAVSGYKEDFNAELTESTEKPSYRLIRVTPKKMQAMPSHWMSAMRSLRKAAARATVTAPYREPKTLTIATCSRRIARLLVAKAAVSRKPIP